MPKNHREPKPVEPEPDSSEESETDDDDSSTDNEQGPVPQTPETPKPVHHDDDGDSDASEESETESDEEEPQLNQKAKPIATAPPPPAQKSTAPPPPANSQKAAGNNTQKAAAKKAEPVIPAKRQAEEKEPSNSKKNKKVKAYQEAIPVPAAKKSKGVEDTSTKVAKSVDSGAESSKKLFQRIWSDDDEIVILQGMLDYEAETKVSPRAGADFDAFLEFIKDKLHVDVNKTQLQDKVRRLKSKYDNNRSKDRNKLIPNLLKRPHDLAVFELSEKVWGNEVLSLSVPVPPAVKAKSSGTAAKSNGKAIVEKDDDDSKAKSSGTAAKSNVKATLEKDDDGSEPMCVDVVKPRRSAYYYGLNDEERILSRGDELFADGTGKGAKEWRKLLKEDMELTMRKYALKQAQFKLVLDNLE